MTTTMRTEDRMNTRSRMLVLVALAVGLLAGCEADPVGPGPLTQRAEFYGTWAAVSWEGRELPTLMNPTYEYPSTLQKATMTFTRDGMVYDSIWLRALYTTTDTVEMNMLRETQGYFELMAGLDNVVEVVLNGARYVNWDTGEELSYTTRSTLFEVHEVNGIIMRQDIPEIVYRKPGA